MAGEWTCLLMAGLAGNAMTEDHRVSGPGPPLMGLIGSTEENDRQRASRCGKVCRSRIGADEEVGTLQQGRRLGDREPAGQIAEPVMMRQYLGRGRIFRSAHDHHAPSVVQKALNEGVPVAVGPRLATVPAPR